MAEKMPTEEPKKEISEKGKRGTANLKPANKRSKEEAKANSSKGGKKSGESRMARKTFNEALVKALQEDGNQDKIVRAVLTKARAGDLKAFELIRDTIGEKPTDKSESIIDGVMRIELGSELDKWAK